MIKLLVYFGAAGAVVAICSEFGPITVHSAIGWAIGTLLFFMFSHPKRKGHRR